MLFLRSSISKLNLKTFIQHAKLFCSQSVTPVTDNYLIFKTGLSSVQQAGVLDVLNTANTDQLYRYGISKNRVKNIEIWRNRKGPFKSLNDVLEVDGLGEKVLEKICKQIIDNNLIEVKQTDSVKKVFIAKYLKDLTVPVLSEKMKDNIQSATGIHITPVGVSWARIVRKDNKLTDWNYQNLTTLPNKITPIDTFELAIKLVKKMTPSDVYILEGQNSMNQKSTVAHNQQMELSAMLLALLNTSIKHNISLNGTTPEEIRKVMENRVFFLKRKVPSRLFGLMVGLETISSVAVVQNLLTKESEEINSSFTSISADSNLQDAFYAQSSANKDLLGQALLLVLSFFDLCIYKNPASLNILYSNTWPKKRLKMKK